MTWRRPCGLVILMLILSLGVTVARRKRRPGRHFLTPNFPAWPPSTPVFDDGQGSFTAELPRPSALPSNPDTLDVWILAGQSNMGGENSNDGEEWPHPLGDPLPAQLLMFPNATGVWRDAQNNMCAISAGCERCTNSLGPGMAFGRTLIHLQLAHRVGFVPTSRGGSCLAHDWMPGQKQYDFMVSTTIKALASAGPFAQLRGMVWVQGESDGSFLVGPHAPVQYADNLRNFIAKVREDLSPFHPLLPIVVAKMSVVNRTGALPHIEGIRRQQEEVLATTPGLIEADQQGCKFYSQDLGKDLGGPTDMHLTKSGVCQLGVHMARKYAASGHALRRPLEHGSMHRHHRGQEA